MKKKTQNKTIGAFEAKTHLSQLLQDVQKGNEITITKRGKPIARLTPIKENENKVKIKDILHEFDSIRNKVKGNVNIRKYILAGRKF